MEKATCPKCQAQNSVKSGIVKGKQRYSCKSCNYSYTVFKDGKNIDPYYVIKALQLHVEGVSLREIERLLGVSHVSVLNWIKKYQMQVPENRHYKPTYKVLKHAELVAFISDPDQVKDAGMIITELGDKFMLIKWDKFKK